MNAKNKANKIETRLPRRGQALVEVMVAVSVLTIGFMGVITLLARALSLNRVVSDSFTATYLASEGVEISKNIIDSNIIEKRSWNAGITPGEYEVDTHSTSLSVAASGRKLFYDPLNHVYGYSGEMPTNFVRKVTVTPVGDGSNEVKINSEVAWTTRGGGSFHINLEDHFYNWR